MISKSQKIRLGVFISLSFLILIVTLGITLAPKIFDVRDTYFIGFLEMSVTGLQAGGPVKYQGLNVGYVSDIKIDVEDIQRVIVEISLEHNTPIRKDTKAQLAFLGITGLKLVELTGGSMQAEALEPGGFIIADLSITDAITGRAEVIAEKAEMVLNNLATMTNEQNQIKVMSMIDNLSSSTHALNTILEKNNNSIDRLIKNTSRSSEDFLSLLSSFKITAERLASISKSDTLNRIVGDVATITASLSKADLVQLVQGLGEALEHTNRMLRDTEVTFSKSRADLVYSIETLREVMDYMNQFSRMISEDPSVMVRGVRLQGAPDQELEK